MSDAGSGHPLYDPIYGDADGYADGDEISTARLALLHDTGKMCADCSAEFVAPNGAPACCETCKNMGSELPVSTHPEVNKEAHKAVARARRERRKKNVDSES